MRPFRFTSDTSPQRRGTTAVEVAATLPVFLAFAVGLMEFGHAMMVVNSLDNAARQAARYGAVDGITTAQTTTRAQALMARSIRVVPTVLVKDASVFDTAGYNAAGINIASLPNKAFQVELRL